MLGQYKSSRIANIHSNFTSLICPLPGCLGELVAVYDNSVGWDPRDRTSVRRVVDLSKSVQLVVTNFKFKSDPMNLLNNRGYGATWKLFRKLEDMHLSGGNGEGLVMYIFVKKTQPPEDKSVGRLSSKEHYKVAINQLETGLSYHFLAHESNEFVRLGEEGVFHKFQNWNERAAYYIQSFPTIPKHVGRIVENCNNNCYANSILAVLCNLPIVRDKVTELFRKCPSVEDIVAVDLPHIALVFIMKVYVETVHLETKSSFLLPYQKKIFNSNKKKEYFDIGIAFNKILFPPTSQGYYESEDQGEWITDRFFSILSEMEDSSLFDLFSFEETKLRRTQCNQLNSIPKSETTTLLEIKLGQLVRQRGSKTMQDLLILYEADEELDDFTMHFRPTDNNFGGSLLGDFSQYEIQFQEKPLLSRGSVVYDRSIGKLATVDLHVDNTVHIVHHVSYNLYVSFRCLFF